MHKLTELSKIMRYNNALSVDYSIAVDRVMGRYIVLIIDSANTVIQTLFDHTDPAEIKRFLGDLKTARPRG